MAGKPLNINFGKQVSGVFKTEYSVDKLISTLPDMSCSDEVDTLVRTVLTRIGLEYTTPLDYKVLEVSLRKYHQHSIADFIKRALACRTTLVLSRSSVFDELEPEEFITEGFDRSWNYD